MARYVIWDEVSDVFTPSGDVFTAEQWLAKYPAARHPQIDLVVAGDSAINGAFCQEYTSFVDVYTKAGCDFTGCVEKQDFLDAIEAFEDARNAEQENYISPEERLAAATEAQVLIALENQSN